MKKTLALILAIVMMAAISIPAFAEDVVLKQDTTDETGVITSSEAEVTYGVSQTYTVTLPSAVDFGTTLAATATVSAADVVIAGNQQLVVSLVSDFTMSCTNCADVAYTVKVGDAENAIASGDDVLVVAASTVAGTPASESATLNFATLGTSQAGNYSDTITFNVAIEDKPSTT